MDRLLADVPAEREERSEEQHAKWLIAHMLDWHRREVDAAQDELYKTRHNPSAHNRLFWARESCRKFVEELRAAGHAI